MKRLWMVCLLPSLFVLAGCASNEELFAEYDAYCQGAACISTDVEVIYEQVEVMTPTMAWEPAVYFGYDLDYLNDTEIARLDRNIAVLNTDESLRISLQAFTDSIASFVYNVDLAERRRMTVLNYFTDAGIASDRIVSSSGSELLPVLPTDSPEDRVINRRVEMMLLDNSGRPVSFGIAFPDESEDFVPPYPAVKIEE